METNLIKNTNMRGKLFEIIAKDILRKRNKNKFIFRTFDFYTIFEIIKKYRLKLNTYSEEDISFINFKWTSADLIEFKLNNTKERKITNIVIYEVKSYSPISFNKLELCKRSYFHYKRLDKKGFSIYLVKFRMKQNWDFDFDVIKLNLTDLYVYSRQEGLPVTHLDDLSNPKDLYNYPVT